MAMMDTVGQVSALSGGYGNSYAQTAGQQAYNAELSNLNEVIPELYGAAQSQYASEGNQMANELSMLQGAETLDRSAYETSLDNWQEELSYLYNKNAEMSEKEYNAYLTDYNKWAADREYWANQAAAEQSQSNWQAEYDLAAAPEASGKKGGGGMTDAEYYDYLVSDLGYSNAEAAQVTGYSPDNVISATNGKINLGGSPSYGSSNQGSSAQGYGGESSSSFTGVKNGKYYKSGQLATGTSNGVYYVNGSPASGWIGNKYYVNGKMTKTKVTTNTTSTAKTLGR
jgi:hypothetical protein